MSTRINITVDSDILLERNRQQVEVNRLKFLTDAAREDAAQEGVDRRNQDLIAAGIDPETRRPLDTSAIDPRPNFEEPGAYRRDGYIWLLPTNFELDDEDPTRVSCRTLRINNRGLFLQRRLPGSDAGNLTFERVQNGLVAINTGQLQSRDFVGPARAEADLSLSSNAISVIPAQFPLTYFNFEGDIIRRAPYITASDLKTLSLELLVLPSTVSRRVTGRFVTWSYGWSEPFVTPEGVLVSSYTIPRLTFWEDGTAQPEPDPWDDPLTFQGWPPYTSGPTIAIGSSITDIPYFGGIPDLVFSLYETEQTTANSTQAALSVRISLATQATYSVTTTTGFFASLGVNAPEDRYFTTQHIMLTISNGMIHTYLNGNRVEEPIDVDKALVDNDKKFYPKIELSTGLTALYTGNNTFIRSDSPVYGAKLKLGTKLVTNRDTYIEPQTMKTLR